MKQPSSWWRSTSQHQLTFQVRALSQPRWAPALLAPPPVAPHPMETALAIGEAKGRKTPRRGIRSLRCPSARGPPNSTTDTVWRSPTRSSSAPLTPELLHASRYTRNTNILTAFSMICSSGGIQNLYVSKNREILFYFEAQNYYSTCYKGWFLL